jgi:hypothetical protein
MSMTKVGPPAFSCSRAGAALGRNRGARRSFARALWRIGLMREGVFGLGLSLRLLFCLKPASPCALALT